MQYWLISNPWAGVIVWVILYISDYYNTFAKNR